MGNKKNGEQRNISIILTRHNYKNTYFTPGDRIGNNTQNRNAPKRTTDLMLVQWCVPSSLSDNRVFEQFAFFFAVPETTKKVADQKDLIVGKNYVILTLK